MLEIFCSAYQAVMILESENLKITQKSISLWKKTGKIIADDFGHVSVDAIRKILIEKKIKIETPKLKVETISKPKQKKIKKPPVKKNVVKKPIEKKPSVKKEKPIIKPVEKVLKKEPIEKKETSPEPEVKLKEKVIKNKKPVVKQTVIKQKKIEKNIPVEKPVEKKDHRQSLLLIKLKGDAAKSRINAKKAQVDYEVSRGNLLDREILTNYINASISAHNDRILNMPRKLANLCIALVRSNDNDVKARIKLEKIFNVEISGILESEKKEIKKFLRKKINASSIK